jgi:hypothetical protein
MNPIVLEARFLGDDAGKYLGIEPELLTGSLDRRP